MNYKIDKKFIIFFGYDEEVYIKISAITMLTLAKNPNVLFLNINGSYYYTATFKNKEERQEVFLKLKERMH